jgi:hypothetical protein
MSTPLEPKPIDTCQDAEGFARVDVDAMIPFKTYRGNKRGNLLFTVVPVEHIEAERASTAIKIYEIIRQKRVAAKVNADAKKKARIDAYYSKLEAELALPVRDVHLRHNHVP